MSTQDEQIAEAVIEKYAESKGMDPGDARKKFMPVLKGDKKAFDVQSQRLLAAVDVLGKVQEISKGTDDATQAMLGRLATGVVATAINPRTGDDDDDIRAVSRYVLKLKALDKAFGSGDIDAIKQEVQSLRAELRDTKTSEEIAMLMKTIEDSVAPLREELAALKEPKTTVGKELTTEQLFDKVSEATDKAKDWLGRAGYKVEMDKGLSREEVKKLIEEESKKAIEEVPPEQLKERLKAAGYKVEGGPITWEQAEKLIQDAYDRGKEEMLDKERVDAVTNLIGSSIKEVVGLFKGPIQLYFEEAITAQGQPPSQGEQPSSQPESSSSGQESPSES